ncbi:DUF866-domain-containing protein [Pluteus cervinus]|uniref:DUF866-domain-containing protein n=1 Tax=Pluteus cervinus TaxID=181527 RepID=A0ACD3BGD6_9AGAR|nr:DUF866-domain-containing protein [Pluteus cervinus]
MVKLQLLIKAELENVTELVPASDDFEYFFQVQCNSCHEIHPKVVALNRIEERELSSSRGAANFIWRCGVCKRESSATFDSSPPKPYSEENGGFAPLLIIECRGLEFIGFDPRGIWKCKGTESGTLFPEVDLSEGEWTEYDEKSTLPVNISNIESKWVRA